MKQKIFDLAAELIRIPSLSPNDNGCQEIIANRLKKVGFAIEWMPFGDTLNLWATHQSISQSSIKHANPCIVLAGHTDVVPAGDENEWCYSPFSAHCVDGKLYGRGAADMKGSLAAMVVVAEEFVSRHPNHQGRIAMLITSDEEASANNGTVRVVEKLMARNEKIDYCIVGEPSSVSAVGDVVKNGRRGSITANLYIQGTQGHVAYPHLADNPVHKSLAMLQELTAIKWDEGNQFFPPTSLQIANIQAGTGSNNVIPGQLFIQFNLRFSTETSDKQIKQRIETLLNKHQLDYRIEWQLSGQPFLTKAGKLLDAILSNLKNIAGITPRLDTGGGTSDGRFIALMGAEIVELGPLNHTIHKVNEYVNCDDLAILGKVYYQTLNDLLT